jgi:hypothetical protein
MRNACFTSAGYDYGLYHLVGPFFDFVFALLPLPSCLGGGREACDMCAFSMRASCEKFQMKRQ